MPRRTRFPDPDQVGTCEICLGPRYRDDRYPGKPLRTACPVCAEALEALHEAHRQRASRPLPPLLRRVVSIHAER